MNRWGFLFFSRILQRFFRPPSCHSLGCAHWSDRMLCRVILDLYIAQLLSYVFINDLLRMYFKKINFQIRFSHEEKVYWQLFQQKILQQNSMENALLIRSIAGFRHVAFNSSVVFLIKSNIHWLRLFHYLLHYSQTRFTREMSWLSLEKRKRWGHPAWHQ